MISVEHIPEAEEGVYAILHYGKPVYIGTSIRPRYRVGQHLIWMTRWGIKNGLSVTFQAIKGKERFAMEEWMIRKHSPLLNGKFRKGSYWPDRFSRLMMLKKSDIGLGVSA